MEAEAAFGGFRIVSTISENLFRTAMSTGVSPCWFLIETSTVPVSIKIRTIFRRPMAAAMCSGESPF
jgi:hypothetical protein